MEEFEVGAPVEPGFGLEPTEIEHLLEFLGFTEEDAERIRAYGAYLNPCLREVAEQLYAHIQEVPALAAVLEGHLTQCRLKQSTYLKQLLQARVDPLYSATRAWIGEVHRRMGVDPRWYMASYCHLEQLIVDRLRTHPALSSDPAAILAVTCSLRKLICFDMIVANEAYAATLLGSRRSEEQALREHAAPVVLDIGEHVFVVPVVGPIDSGRREAVQGALLQAFARGARAILIDVSRLPTLDGETAKHLFDLAGDLATTDGLLVAVSGMSDGHRRQLLALGTSTAGLKLMDTLAEAVAAARPAAPATSAEGRKGKKKRRATSPRRT